MVSRISRIRVRSGFRVKITVAPMVLTDQYVSSCNDNYFPCFRHRLVFYVFHDFVLIKQSIATEQKTALVELPFGRDKLRRIIFGIHGG